ncbi:hypothetical protein DSM107133_02244 [Pseudosulfitobacter sp. DSM 107133]|nr:hypothetical protein DSM107133_02244 [Pseudosulfitobacter sp. DSM 107133]
MGGTATGTIVNGVDRDTRDYDWFAIDLVAGQTYRFAASSTQTDDIFFVGFILDSAGQMLDTTNTSARGTRTFVAPEDGRYFVSVTTLSWEQLVSRTYQVSAEAIEPIEQLASDPSTEGRVEVGGSTQGVISDVQDIDWYRVTLEAGTIYRIDLEAGATAINTLPHGFIGGVFNAASDQLQGFTSPFAADPDSLASTTFTPNADGDYFIAAFGATGPGGTYTLSVSEEPPIVDDFPETFETTGRLVVGTDLTGEINPTGDVDRIGIDVVAGTIYSVEMLGTSTGDGTLSDPLIAHFFDESFTLIGGGDDDSGSGSNARAILMPTSTGTYFMDVRSFIPGGVGTYTLRLSTIEDDFSDDASTTGTLAIGGTADGRIDYTYYSNDHGKSIDSDWFRVSLEAGNLYSFRIDEREDPSNPYYVSVPQIALVDEDGNRLSDYYRDPYGYYGGSSFGFLAEETGDYFLQVNNLNDYATEGSYQVSANLVLEALEGESIGSKQVRASWEKVGSHQDEIFYLGSDYQPGWVRGVGGNDVLIGGTGDEILIGDDSESPSANPYRSAEIFRAYELLLGRAPDASGLADMLDTYVSTYDIARILVYSKEFANLHGTLDNSAFVDLLYTQLRGSAPAADDVFRQDLIAQLDSYSYPEWIAPVFFNSGEFGNRVAGRDLDFALQDYSNTASSQTIFDAYAAVLDRAPDLGGFLGWMARMNSGLDAAGLAQGMLGSAEFAAKAAGSDAAFVAAVSARLEGGTAFDTDTVVSLLESGALSRAAFVAAAITLEDGAGLADWMRAQGTDDILVSGGGADTMIGGALSDRFVFAPDGMATARILDLEAWDTLDLRAFDFADRDSARAAFVQDGDDLVFAAQDTQIRIDSFDLAGLGDQLLLV